MKPSRGILLVFMTALLVPVAAAGQGRPDPSVIMAAQRDAMTPLTAMDGAWRGSGWMLSPSGEKQTFTQTERVGPFLDGSIKVMEGRGYGADDELAFNAFGIISYDPGTKAYTLHSYAQGRSGDFTLKLTNDGFTWEIPAGPMTIRYTAVIKDGSWHETGDRMLPEKDPVRFLEMDLVRAGDTAWPSEGALGPNN